MPSIPLSLATLRRYAIAKLGFVQADPIRAPARAQDLILRHPLTFWDRGVEAARVACAGLAQLGVAADLFRELGRHIGGGSAGRKPEVGLELAELRRAVPNRLHTGQLQT